MTQPAPPPNCWAYACACFSLVTLRPTLAGEPLGQTPVAGKVAALAARAMKGAARSMPVAHRRLMDIGNPSQCLYQRDGLRSHLFPLRFHLAHTPRRGRASRGTNGK